jgi:hypothetical protein
LTNVLSLKEGRALVEERGEERKLGQFDSVIVAVGNHPFDPLSRNLLEMGFQVQVIGDAARPGKIYDAIVSGHRAGMAL